MVYKHRTQKGKTINFRNKGAYESWKRGMFANMNPSSSVGRKVAKAKTKSRKRMKHAGVGKVSSGKALCDTCRGKDLKLSDGRCKKCVKEFSSFKQPNIQDQARRDILDRIMEETTLTEADILAIENNYDIKFDDAADLETWSDVHSNAMELQNSESEFEIYRDKETAIEYAISLVGLKIDQSPEDFNESLLHNHITMTDADIRMVSAQEAEDRYDWQGFSDDDLKHRFGKGYDETQSREQLIELGKDEEYKRIKKELEESPLAYYVTDTGFYTKTELMKQDWIKIDSHGAAEEAIREDGVAHYVARADGEEFVTPSGKYVYRVR